MEYQDVLDVMFNSLPMYQRVGKAAYKADLSNTWALAELTDHPEKSFKSIHIAGTNGKGSTAHMLASIFQEAGYITGLYTSPHLIDFRERIKINGEMIPKERVASFYSSYHNKWEHIQPSFFEMTVLMAFDHFKTESVDIAIIETGLGGRLDSTNIVLPEVSVITNIGLDHTQFLGETIELIAAEKAGIIKENTPVVLGNMNSSAKSVISSIATQKDAPILLTKTTKSEFDSDLKGTFQEDNINTVLTTIEAISAKGQFYIQTPHIIAGLKHVKSNTGLRGRYETLGLDPKIIADGAHNSAGITMLLDELSHETYDNLHVVWSMVSDKDISQILSLLPKNAHYYFCESSVPRALSSETLHLAGHEHGLNGSKYSSVQEALSKAKKTASKQDLILITGSFFTVADSLLS